MGTGGTVDYLRGEWAVERQIIDRRNGQTGVFTGTAGFRPTADGGLDYAEVGDLRFGGHHGPARRSLRYDARADGSADVRFADGRELYRLDLQNGQCEADHPCRADAYHVAVTRLSSDAFAEIWQVSGPEKNYELRTLFRRMPAGAGRIPAGEAG